MHGWHGASPLNGVIERTILSRPASSTISMRSSTTITSS